MSIIDVSGSPFTNYLNWHQPKKGRLAMFKLDNSRRSCFVKCPYRYDLTYNRGISPVKGSTALRYGSTFHAAMEGLYTHVKENGWTRDGKSLEAAVTFAKEVWDEESDKHSFYEDYKTFDNLVKSVVLYLNFFADDEGLLKVLHNERAFAIRMDSDLYFTGKLDMEMEISGMRWINEFKTTGRDIPFISNQQHRDFQFVGYNYALKIIYDNVAPEGIMITYHQLTAYKSRKTGEYGEAKINFDRIPMFFSEQDFLDWERSFRFTAAQINICQKVNTWPKNFDSCYIYGACPYLFLCEQKRPPGEENLAGEYVVKTPWNVLDTVPDDKIIVID